MSVRILVDNSQRVASQLEQLGPKLIDGVLLEIEASSKPFTPVDTGQLLRGTHVEKTSPTSGAVVNEVEYAVYVHQGTRFVGARPFLIQGFLAAQDRIVQFLQQAVRQAAR